MPTCCGADARRGEARAAAARTAAASAASARVPSSRSRPASCTELAAQGSRTQDTARR